MKDLKCGLKTCKHNKGYCCCSKEISVNENSDCMTYSHDESKKTSAFEAAEDFTPANYTVNTNVKCTAPCVFNKNDKCIANGITVMSETGKASCLTFMKS